MKQQHKILSWLLACCLVVGSSAAAFQGEVLASGAGLPSGATGEDQWGVYAIGAADFSEYTTKKNGVNAQPLTIAVIDTGIHADNKLFEGKLVHPKNFTTENGGDEQDVTDADSGHGTFVSTIILDTVGSCNVNLMPIKVMGNSYATSVQDIADAIDYAVANGAKIINMSFGTVTHDPSLLVDSAIKTSVQAALAQDVLLVGAAGNNHLDMDEGDITVIPPEIEGVFTVSAVDSYGALWTEMDDPNLGSNYGTAVDIAAPGVDVSGFKTSGDKLSRNAGTSFAAPHVTGAAALLRIADPSLTVAQIKQKLIDSAKNLNSTVGDERYFGAGRVDINSFIYPRQLEMAVGIDREEISQGESVTFSIVTNDIVKGVSIAIDGRSEEITNGVGQKTFTYTATLRKSGTTAVKITANAYGNQIISKDYSIKVNPTTVLGTPDTSWYNTTDTVFTLYTAEELFGLAQIVNAKADGISEDNFTGKTILLGADINLSNVEWTPIGDASINPNTGGRRGFNGTFNGLYHKIDNLQTTGSNSFSGLFGYTGYSVVIRNVGIESGSVEGGSPTAALIGQSTGGRVENCYNKASVSGNSYVGGLVGQSGAILSGCYNEGNVTGTGMCVGGIVGKASGTKIKNSYNAGTIIGTTSVGGIIGETSSTNSSALVVANSYNTGAVGDGTGGSVGGIIGQFWGGTVNTCYNSGEVKGGSYVGGIIGDMNDYHGLYAASQLIYSINIGNVSGSDIVGTMTGGAVDNSLIDSSCWYLQNNDTNMGVAAVGSKSVVVETKTDATTLSSCISRGQKRLDSAEGYYTWNNIRLNMPARVVTWTTADIYDSAWPAGKGEGTEEMPYLIDTEAEFGAFAAMVNNGRNFSGECIRLNADLDMAQYQWEPIGSSFSVAFQGIFDGNGKTVRGVQISRQYIGGIFGMIGARAQIKNLTVEQIKVELSVASGAGIAAIVNGAGVIENCHTKGGSISSSLTGMNDAYLGGIVGDLQQGGKIKNCSNTADITTQAYTAGGIVGGTRGTVVQNAYIENCYNAGTVSAGRNIGGIIGNMGVKSELINSYNSGAVVSTGLYQGAVVGLCNGEIADAYFLQTDSVNTALEATGNTSDQKNHCTAFDGTGTLKTAVGASTTLIDALNSKAVTGYRAWVGAGSPFPSFGQYLPNSYTLTFQSNGGTQIDPQNVWEGKTAVTPADPEKQGYVFDGWYTDSALGTSWNAEEPVMQDLTLYAKWTAGTSAYTVEHYRQDVTGDGYTKVDADTQNLTATTDTTATAVAKEYTGFTENTTHEARVPSGTAAANGSLVLKLYYDRDTYEVSFDLGEAAGDVPPAQTIRYGGTAQVPEAPTREGYIFDGWYTNDGMTEKWDSDAEVTEALCLYAKWTAAEASYTVEHYQQDVTGDGYTKVNSDTENIASTVGAEVTAVAKEYTGFVENMTHADRIASGTIPASGTLLLKLYYDRETYSVSFDLNGAEGTSPEVQSVRYGANVTLPNEPVREGYNFAGWYQEEACETEWKFETDTVKKELTLYAKWEPIFINGFSMEIHAEKIDAKNISIEVQNRGEETRAELFIAEYDENGCVMRITKQTVTIAKQGYQTEYTLAEDMNRVGIFLWDMNQEVQLPLCERKLV